MKAYGYTIKDLEVLSGIKAHTIRIWEKRYRLLIPKRTATNIRYYTDDDLKRILNVSLLVKNGYKISKVSVWREEEIKEAVLNVGRVNQSEESYIERLMVYMLNFDNHKLHKTINETIEGYGFEEAIFKVFFLLFERIGAYWQVGSIFPAQEHYLSNVIRQKLIVEIDRIELNNTRGKTMLFYLHEKEMHELSLLFYSYLARKAGYNVVYLGQFVPFSDLEKMSSQLEVDFVFTAFITSYPKTELEQYLNQLKKLFPQQKVFITGWQISKQNPNLPRNVKSVKNIKEFKKYLK